MKYHGKLIVGLIAAAMIAHSEVALAQAKIDFALYEGKPIIKTGEGGTKLTKHGIDYWTSGEPPRRYQVIAMVQDKRDEMWDGGHAIGSPSIASKVKSAGGDAVIIQSENEAGHGGGFSSGSGGLGWLFGLGMSGGSKTVTRMLVVKYLPDEPTAATSPPPSPSPSGH